jgi:hypothetical protein
MPWPQRTIEERLRARIDTSGDCWLWTGTTKKTGYGHMSVAYRKLLVHRLAYSVWVGPIPPGLLVCHHCDNPPCVRPDHLFLGTHRDNMQDMIRKGRQSYASWAGRPWSGARRGERNPFAKLTEAQAQAIRSSDRSDAELACLHGVSRRTVNDIRAGRAWPHLAEQLKAA